MKLVQWIKSLFPKPKQTPNYLFVDGLPYDISTKQGAEDFERALDESNDIYKLVARIQKYVAEENLALTNAGRGLCNTFALLLKELHTFADKIADDGLHKELKAILKKHEQTPKEILKWATPRKGSK
jgi:hypothetical protein